LALQNGKPILSLALHRANLVSSFWPYKIVSQHFPRNKSIRGDSGDSGDGIGIGDRGNMSFVGSDSSEVQNRE
jgi:hypothetical protein